MLGILSHPAVVSFAAMAKNKELQILLTNDDGIRSPGLWAAAEALGKLGFVTVAAPREQSSGTGRSMPVTSDGIICEELKEVAGENWKVYAVGGTPAQAVQHGVLELMPQLPDLVVAGINYGENIGLGVTISGTVGAALEGAARGVPSLAVSLETPIEKHLSYSEEVDFSAAAYFTSLFARRLLAGLQHDDLSVLKIDIPCDATPETPWKVTRLSRALFFEPVAPSRTRLDEPAKLGYRAVGSLDSLEPGSDSYVLHIERAVAVTPLSMDLTSRLDLPELDDQLRQE
jgi:5'-nucleotidase